MSTVPPIRPPGGKHVATVLIALIAALLCRAWLQVTLEAAGAERRLAADLAYLAVPLVLAILLLPVLRRDRRFIRGLFARDRISLRALMAAVAIGLLFRLAWWSQLIARVAFGWQGSPDPDAVVGPSAYLACPPSEHILLGIVVTVLLIPPIEELVHRGYVQTFFYRRGTVVAIAVSTVVFTIAHPYAGWGIALAGGALLGTLYRVSGSLWPPVVTHAVINLEPQLTWRCLNIQWNPPPEQLPVWSAGLTATTVFCLAAALLIWLVLTPYGRRGKAPAP